MLLIDDDWMMDCRFDQKLFTWLLLLDQDVKAVQLAYRDFAGAQARVRNSSPTDGTANFRLGMAEVFHYAKTFVCAVRRVGRIVEASVRHRAEFGGCSDAIRTAWRKHKALFDGYVDARNAIEHIDAEAGTLRLLNLEGDTLKVTSDKAAVVSQASLDAVLELRTDIIVAARASFHRVPRS